LSGIIDTVKIADELERHEEEKRLAENEVVSCFFHV
jgi:hypothetical protein